MNFLTLFSAGILLTAATQIQAQATEQKKPDNPPKCTNIKEGTFVRPNYPEAIWYMTIKDNVQTEYFNNGKDFIKSTLVFVDDCNYKAIVLEKSDKNDPAQIGDVFNNKIVATQDNILKVNTKIEGTQFDIVYVKVK
ncbi:hypothetical protein J2795_001190 [Chryseobacterium bernardetii]|jgi:hypothetical protein|uniref:Lipocalin-like protein n=2 Tax=Chryseobacterium TaxID=59732 RepID=A0A543EJW2_9FLAO|nr:MULTISPECIES: hypothetical protein [Chryseobacterium]MDR6370267.1 hypothetical protein [Chryseobacterium vietnamense]MDR6440490.1 hypothetical protein [Chryseobacterium bernardetii]MDR6486944.1 hypothetical protein [Chryseobacterium vietnamense]TQM21881.1 hypothetical protein FB551_1581 [Chryseobacterium aquifrigidense]